MSKKRGKYKTYTPEQRDRIVAIALRAIMHGWSLRKFSRMAKISHVTLLGMLSADEHFDRYRRAMEAKALDLPQVAMDVVRRLISPKERPLLNDDGQVMLDTKGRPVFVSDALDPKAARVALSHIEFRMMREIKHDMYTQRAIQTRKTDIEDMDTKELEKRLSDFRRRVQAESMVEEAIEIDAVEVEPPKNALVKPLK